MKNWVKGVIAGAVTIVTGAAVTIVSVIKNHKNNVIETTAEELPSGENNDEIHASEESTKETSMEEV